MDPAAGTGAASDPFAEGIVAEVTAWGPQRTEQGSRFNVQPDGHSGLWFVASNAPSWVRIRIDGELAPTQVNERVITSGLFDKVQDRILASPGRYAIVLEDPMKRIAQEIGYLEVTPRAERALLPDGSRSLVFCPVEKWGPDQTQAGVAENAQPDGSMGMWFRLPCAPENLQLVFGDDRLPATRTDFGYTSSVPLALIEAPGTVQLALRDRATGEILQVGSLTIEP